MAEASDPPKFRFSLANTLHATAWACLSGGPYASLMSDWHDHPLPSKQFPPWMWPWAPPLLLFLIVWAPIVAVGALFGRTKHGMVIGLVLIVSLYVVSLMFFLPRVH